MRPPTLGQTSVEPSLLGSVGQATELRSGALILRCSLAELGKQELRGLCLHAGELREGIRGKPSRKVCVFMHTRVRRCSPVGEEGREGSSQPGKERLEVAQGDGRSGVTVAHLLSSRLLYHTTLSSPEWPSVQLVLERDRRQFHKAALCSATLVSPFQTRELDDHLAPGYHLGLLSQGTMERWSGPRLSYEEQP